jgi:hypothetical protein
VRSLTVRSWLESCGPIQHYGTCFYTVCPAFSVAVTNNPVNKYDKSYEEVAYLLDLPIGTVKTYLYRARKSIVPLLGKKKGSGFL